MQDILSDAEPSDTDADIGDLMAASLEETVRWVRDIADTLGLIVEV